MIASRYNAKFKELKSLLEPKGAKKIGQVIASGRKIVPELKANAYVCAQDEWPEDWPMQTKVIWLDRALFRELDVLGTHFPLAVCDLPRAEKFAETEPQGLELVLCLQDPANLGAILRSAEAFMVERVILLKDCAFPFHPRAIRSSSGSCFRVPLVEGPLLKDYQDKFSYALDKSGTSLNQFDWPKNIRLMLGQEGQGFQSIELSHRLAIDIHPKMDSLNAPIAASIACFSYRNQHPLLVEGKF